MRVIGIDPGLTGAIASVDSAGDAIVFDMPTMPYSKTGFVKNAVDPAELTVILCGMFRMGARAAVIERVQPFKDQGISSAYSMAMSYWGAVCAATGVGCKYHLVTPQRWKAHFGLGRDKNDSRALAAKLYPDLASEFKRKKDADRAEAVLIARYYIDMLDSLA